jgi:dTDP-4-dehydrorhamnose reductase
MRILVLGHRGWIGSMVVRLLEKEGLDYATTDIRPENKEEFEKEVISLNVSHIMSFIGRTHGTIGEKTYTTIDYLEQSGKLVENVRDNLFSPLVVAMICKKLGIHFTYMGTGCIFKYDGERLFNEEDTPNFFGSSYSIVKGYTDELMHLLDDVVLNLRIRMPITSRDEPRNFISKIIRYEYVCSVPNSMSVLDELLPIMIDMIKKNITGTFNFTNPNVISHNEILEMYREYVDAGFTWKNFSLEEQRAILAADRSNNHLDTSKLETLYPNIKPIRESVREVMKCFVR